MGQELIQKLLKAEDDAQKIIASARDGRAKKLRDVRTAADEELIPFKQAEESRFAQEQAQLGTSGSGVATELEAATQQELGMVRQDYENNKKQTIKYVLDKVLDIDLSIPDNVRAMLASGQ